MSKEIKLTQNKVTVVDDADFEELNKYKWCAMKTHTGKWVAARAQPITNKTILMHRQIMRAPSSKQVDHRDGDSLNNQRENLRLCTHAQNCLNKTKRWGGK